MLTHADAVPAGTWQDDVRPFLGHTSVRVDAPPDAAPIVICPGKPLGH